MELARVGEAIRQASLAMRNHQERALATTGLSFSQAAVLDMLQRKGRMTLSEIATSLGVTQANVTGLVDRLERDGLAYRSRSNEDKRITFARLTEKGVAATADLNETMTRSFLDLLGDVADEDLSVLTRVMDGVKARAEETVS